MKTNSSAGNHPHILIKLLITIKSFFEGCDENVHKEFNSPSADKIIIN